MLIIWALFFVAGWIVSGYGFARLRVDHDDALVWRLVSDDVDEAEKCL